MLTIVLVAVDARHRRFDRVPNLGVARGNLRGSSRSGVTLLPTDEEVTAQGLNRAHDGVDDLVDPRNPRHGEWAAQHESDDAGGGSPEAPTT